MRASAPSGQQGEIHPQTHPSGLTEEQVAEPDLPVRDLRAPPQSTGTMKV